MAKPGSLPVCANTALQEHRWLRQCRSVHGTPAAGRPARTEVTPCGPPAHSTAPANFHTVSHGLRDAGKASILSFSSPPESNHEPEPRSHRQDLPMGRVIKSHRATSLARGQDVPVTTGSLPSSQPHQPWGPTSASFTWRQLQRELRKRKF